MSSVKATTRTKSAPTEYNFPKTELEKATIRFAGDSSSCGNIGRSVRI